MTKGALKQKWKITTVLENGATKTLILKIFKLEFFPSFLGMKRAAKNVDNRLWEGKEILNGFCV